MKISLDLENCYGIRKLRHEFDFATGPAFLVYAPNGCMKTSLAKVIRDVSHNEQPKDAFFPQRPTKCLITCDPATQLDEDHVFVVNPYEEAFSSGRIATLLVNRELKARYETIHEAIQEAGAQAVSEAARAGEIGRNAVQQFLDAFDAKPNDLYSLLETFETDVRDAHIEFADVRYQDIVNERVQEFVATPGIAELLAEYVEKYNELIGRSRYFRKGVFNHNNAANVSKSLKDNGFFTARHSVSLADEGDKKQEISNQGDFDRVIQEEKERILNDRELSQRFDAIDKAITRNEGLRSFRACLDRYPQLIPELVDFTGLKRKIWTAYLATVKELFEGFLSKYRQGKTELSTIMSAARQQSTLWHEVVSIFNERFSVPFLLEIENQEDVILKDASPTIVFRYKDGDDQCTVGQDQLLNHLSTGEKRALYLLNVIFELHGRSSGTGHTLVVIDDIADSFDYKNKFAIIEYLKDNLDTGKFMFIILTHNFDFFRTVQMRLNIGRRYNCLMSVKTDVEVSLVQAQYLHPFETWKKTLPNNKTMLIACIPMARNLIEYGSGQEHPDYLKLTSLLHQKPDTNTIALSDLEGIFNRVLSLELSLGNGTVLPLIFQQADVCTQGPESLNLENKVVLSIAIRLKAEEVMIRKINSPLEVASIQGQQTAELFDLFKTRSLGERDDISLLNRVVMMTPEPIHLNSFMYEPLIDLSDRYLRDLYTSVKAFSERA